MPLKAYTDPHYHLIHQGAKIYVSYNTLLSHISGEIHANVSCPAAKTFVVLKVTMSPFLCPPSLVE